MRAQIQTAVGMILTLVIVAATLTLGTWGFIAISNSVSDTAYERVYDTLDSSANSYESYGSRHVARIAPPEDFCVFNTTLSGTESECTPGYSGYELCQRLEAYWKNAGALDDNVRFVDGRGDRIENIDPRNGRFACFSTGSRYAFVEGRGTYAAVSPMRELESFTLEHTGSGETLRVGFFTSQPQQGAQPELFYVYNREATPSFTYENTTLTYDVGGVPLTSLQVTLDASQDVQNVGTTPTSVLDSLEVPQD